MMSKLPGNLVSEERRHLVRTQREKSVFDLYNNKLFDAHVAMCESLGVASTRRPPMATYLSASNYQKLVKALANPAKFDQLD
jgi:hypothetical protein